MPFQLLKRHLYFIMFIHSKKYLLPLIFQNKKQSHAKFILLNY